MSNQSQKKETWFFSPSAIQKAWRSFRSRPPSPSHAFQTLPTAGGVPSGAPSSPTPRSPSPSRQNTDIQSLVPPASADQTGSTQHDEPSSYLGGTPEIFCHRIMAIYDKLPTAQSTRILKFTPPLLTDDSNTIRCEWTVISMTHPGSYHALSYVWGNPDIKEYTLICNGHGMKITYNLWAALRRVWARWPDLKLWVDAVCINQEDIPERNQQVSMMGQIYGQAECVAIWLGDETSETSAFFELLKLVESGKDLSPANCTWSKDLETERSFVFNLLNAGDDITRRPWYIRAWTLQEFRLSRAAVVLCGPHMAKFQLVISTISKINEKSSGMDFCGARTVAIPIHGPASSFLSLYRLLAFTQNRQATDPRDKIFSLMSLLPRNLYSFMKPDYHMSVEETFTWACRICISIDNEMNCLAGAGLAGREKSNLPSWVVDWRKFNSNIYQWQNISRSLKDVEANPELCRIRHQKGRMLDRASTQISIPGLALGILEVDQANGVAFLKVFPQCAFKTLDSKIVPDVHRHASRIKLSDSALLKGYEAIRKHAQRQCNCTPNSGCDAYRLGDMPEGIETGDWLWTTELGDTRDNAQDRADEITHFHYAVRPVNMGEDARFQLVGKTNGLQSIAGQIDWDMGKQASVGVSWQSTFLFI